MAFKFYCCIQSACNAYMKIYYTHGNKIIKKCRALTGTQRKLTQTQISTRDDIFTYKMK